MVNPCVPSWVDRAKWPIPNRPAATRLTLPKPSSSTFTKSAVEGPGPLTNAGMVSFSWLDRATCAPPRNVPGVVASKLTDVPEARTSCRSG